MIYQRRHFEDTRKQNVNLFETTLSYYNVTTWLVGLFRLKQIVVEKYVRLGFIGCLRLIFLLSVLWSI